MDLVIRQAVAADFDVLAAHEHHIPPGTLRKSIDDGHMLIAEVDGAFAGWLRWNLFWDLVPFMNLLFVEAPCRGRGVGCALTEHWEAAMRAAGHDKVMTSSAQDECAQHFYVKQGYRAVGSFLLRGDPLEILFEKRL